MNRAALQHLCRAPFVYPVGEAHLRLILKAAQGDLRRAAVAFGDRYDGADDRDDILPMIRVGEDGLHEYWGVTAPVPTRRLRYRLYAEGTDGESVWITERGLAPRRAYGYPFQFPYLHRGDRFRQPEWIREAVFYQIFPDRFCNGDLRNDPPKTAPWGRKPTPTMMTGGDLAGIRQRLPYLRDLGINALYTTPLFVSPSNHKYDTTDYYRIDPAFGSNAEFARLVQEARRMGIRFILDGVFNHSGREWFAFQDVVKHGRKSAYRDWFYDLHSLPPDPSRINYETFSNGISTMPKLDTSHPRCAAYFLDVAEYWIKTADIDGWRLDVANEVDHRFWRAFRQRVKSLKPDAFLLGELMHEATDWLQGDQFDSSMNYPWRDATLAFLQCRMDAREYDQELTRLRFAQTAEANRGLLNLLGSHDTPRIRTEVGSAERAGLAAVLLLTASGVPLIYYGDEIGMEGGPDPDCRRCYPWDKPKQQRADLLALYRRLIQIRRACPWLNDGAWQTLLADPLHSVYVYRRLSAPPESPRRPDREDRLTIVLNNTGRTQEISLPLEGETTNLLCDCMNAGRVIAPDRLALPPLGLSILASESLAKSILR